MKTTTRLTILFAALSALLLVLNIFFLMNQDRNAPAISFPDAATTYRAGADTDALLEGVTAWDAKDGDVSDTLRVSDIIPMSDGQAMVVYIAKDRSKNIGEASRAVNYID